MQMRPTTSQEFCVSIPTGRACCGGGGKWLALQLLLPGKKEEKYQKEVQKQQERRPVPLCLSARFQNQESFSSYLYIRLFLYLPLFAFFIFTAFTVSPSSQESVANFVFKKMLFHLMRKIYSFTREHSTVLT